MKCVFEILKYGGFFLWLIFNVNLLWVVNVFFLGGFNKFGGVFGIDFKLFDFVLVVGIEFNNF